MTAVPSSGEPQTVHLAYGRDGLPVSLPPGAVVIAPAGAPALADPAAAVREALAAPLGSPPLADLIAPEQRVAIVTSDLTRPVPNQLLLEALLTVLHARGVRRDDVVLVNGTGMHRGNTTAELTAMYGAEIATGYRVVNHDARDRATLREVATDPRGASVAVNREYLDADVRIVTGFIEPHVFAGYSGGGKGVMPGLAGREAVLSNHSAAMVGHPRATFGVTEGNPVFEEMRRFALLTEPTFLLNVTMNSAQEVTGVFAGELVAAHEAGIAACREQALVELDAPFDIVVATNGGYPADLNLYQSVKGIAVAARAVRTGGHVILAAECREGAGHAAFRELLGAHASLQALLEALSTPGAATTEDQWQAQLLALARRRATVWLHSSLDAAETARAQLRYCAEVGETVRTLAAEIEARADHPATIGVLPYGQQAVPVVRKTTRA